MSVSVSYVHELSVVDSSTNAGSISMPFLLPKNASFETLLDHDAVLKVPSLHPNDWESVRKIFQALLYLTKEIYYPLEEFLDRLCKNSLVQDIELIGGALPLQNTLSELANAIFAKEPHLREMALSSLQENGRKVFDIDFVIRLPRLPKEEKIAFIKFFLETLSQNILEAKVVKSNCLDHFQFSGWNQNPNQRRRGSRYKM